MAGFGLRIDGTEKGWGFDRQTLPDGSMMTEFSAGTPQNLYPLVYEGILPWEMDTLAQFAMDNQMNEAMRQIERNAYEQSILRKMQGKPAFALPTEGAW